MPDLPVNAATKPRVKRASATVSPAIDIITAIKHPKLIADDISPAQEVILRALYGLPLQEGRFETRFFDSAACRFHWEYETALDMWKRCTGRASYEPFEYREAMLVCGRRSGKTSKVASNVVIYEANFRQHALGKGEEGDAFIISQSKKQAKKAFKYTLNRQEGSPVLKANIIGEVRSGGTTPEYDLKNDITVGVWPCSFRSTRGPSGICAVCDEVAFWRDDDTGANPAAEVISALRPSMATFPHAKLIQITSPYAKAGMVWDVFRKRDEHHEVLCWLQPSWELNPIIPTEFLKAEYRRDSDHFMREYGAEFYESASNFLPPEAVDACVAKNVISNLPVHGRFYSAALDVGFTSDAFGFCLSHVTEQGKVVEDYIESWRGSRAKPVQFEPVLDAIAGVMRRYGCSTIGGDRVCSEPVKQYLAKKGIRFEQQTTLGTRAQTIYSGFRALVVGGRIELLDHPAGNLQLKRLELIVSSGGNQRVEASQGHDDIAVVRALAAFRSVQAPSEFSTCEFIAPDRIRDESHWRRIA